MHGEVEGQLTHIVYPYIFCKFILFPSSFFQRCFSFLATLYQFITLLLQVLRFILFLNTQYTPAWLYYTTKRSSQLESYPTCEMFINHTVFTIIARQWKSTRIRPSIPSEVIPILFCYINRVFTHIDYNGDMPCFRYACYL